MMPNLTKSDISEIHRENKRWPAHLVQVPLQEWAHISKKMKERNSEAPDEVWRSRDFVLQKYGNEKECRPVRLTFSRAMVRRDGHYVDGITWDELMELKRQAGYGDRLAIEFFPPDADIVNVANMRHLFVVPRGVKLPIEHWVI